MLQHMMLSYFMPPLVLLATPDVVAAPAGRYREDLRIVTFMTKPVVATVVFNVRRDGHPHPAGRQRIGAERAAALLAAPRCSCSPPC